MENPQCQYEGNSAQLYLSLFIIFGTIASYLPQHVQIVLLNSSEGINHFFLLLGTVSAYCNVINIIILQWDLVLCCARISLTTCLESLLGMFQIIMQWFMFFIIFLLYFVYYPKEKKYEPLSSQASLISTQQRPTANWKHSIIVFYTVFIHLFFTTLIALILLSKESLRDYSVKFGNLQGIISMLLASIQYIPQILETVRRGEMGALSIPMMLIQCPGALLFIYSIQIRPGTNWTSWITYAVAGMSQFVLICLGVWFFIRDRYFRRGILNPIVQGHSHNILVNNQKSYTNPTLESPQFENNDDSPSTSRSNPPSYDENTPILSG